MSAEGWQEEMRSAYLYRIAADSEKDTPREALFRALAGEAESQAAIWASRQGGKVAGGYKPDLRTCIVAWLVKQRGPRAMRGVLSAMKVRGLSIYTHDVPGHPQLTSMQDMASRHEGPTGGGNMRAAVFGVNDGLISNVSLILGVAGAAAEPKTILLTGIAGLLAGAFSMAAGEWVSVRSQREMYEHQIALEKNELDEYPEEEAGELALIYIARGMNPADAKRIADATIADPERALAVLAREELGLNPDELGSPWGAAIFSFLSFAFGAVVPLLPFLFLSGDSALYGAIGLTGVTLFGVGSVISLFTGRSAWRDGLRMLLIGAGVGAVTFGIGKLIGVSIA